MLLYKMQGEYDLTTCAVGGIARPTKIDLTQHADQALSPCEESFQAKRKKFLGSCYRTGRCQLLEVSESPRWLVGIGNSSYEDIGMSSKLSR